MAEKIDLTSEELERTVLEITTGVRFVDFNHYSNITDYLIFSQPSGFDRLWADHIFRHSLQEAISCGLPREDSMPEEFIEKYFTEEDQNNLDALNKKIEAYEVLVAKGIPGSTVHDQNKEKLKEFTSKAQFLISKRSNASQLSADFKALEDKYYALMSKCVLNTNREPLWKSLEELNEGTDLQRLESLLYDHFLPFLVGYDTKTLRFIARSGQWTTRFYAAKHAGVDLFSRKPEDFSADQLALLSWSIFYYDITQMSEEYRPADEIIDDDEKLDDYIERLGKRLKAERAGRKTALDRKSKLNTSDHQNVIVTADNRNYVDLHKSGIYSDPREITGRTEKEGQTSYNEAAEVRKLKNELKMKRKKNKQK